MSEIDERVRQWFIKRAKSSSTGKVLTKGVMARLRADVLDDPLALRKALVLLRDDGHLDFTPDERGEPVSSYIAVIQPEEATPAHVRRWLDVIAAAGLAPNDTAALLQLGDTIADLAGSDMGHLLNGLLRLRDDQNELVGQPVYLVSAEYLLGSSKLLTSLPRRALKAFGIDPCCFPSHPLYVVVAGCAIPETVVLVENPASFERAVATRAVERCAFVATFGFGLSNAQEDYGNQLAGMVEDRFSHAITLRREGASCPDARDLLSHENITFWGDLDLAGIEIYQRLKKAIPGLRLSALYGGMVEAAAHPARSHPYAKATGKERQPTMPRASAICDVVAIGLLEACKARCVDQEYVSAQEIEKHAHQELASADLSAKSALACQSDMIEEGR